MHEFQSFEILLEPGQGPGNRIFINGHELRDWYALDVHKEVGELSRIEIAFWAEGRVVGAGSTNMHQPEVYDTLVEIAEQWGCKRIMRPTEVGLTRP